MIWTADWAKDAPTVVDLVTRRAGAHPDRTAYIFLADGETETARFSYADAGRRARAIAAALRERTTPGDRALITYSSQAGPEYISAFLGCLFAGVIAVPCDDGRGRAGQRRLEWIAADARPRLILGPADSAGPATGAFGIETLDVATIPDEQADSWKQPLLSPGSVALLQYTSGSTRDPRGVMVTHGNVLANERAIEYSCQNDGDTTFVGWLPLFHDMGLIANALQPIWLGSTSVLMPPAAFLAEPSRWLKAITRYRGVTSGGPNMAYDLCVSRTDPETVAALDLTSWRCAFNGAEVIRPGSIQRFSAAFAPAGFSPETFFPCFGLAEATLIVSGAQRGQLPHVLPVDSDELAHRRLTPQDDGRALVSSGVPVDRTDIRIVDPDTESQLPEGELGEVWVSGDSVASGYWNRPDETARTFEATLTTAPGSRFLRTGDLGGQVGGELFVAGRLKDMIIVNGQNHYPDDLEVTVEGSDAALRPSCGAVFAIDDGSAEHVIVVYETSGDGSGTDVESVAARVRSALGTQHGVRVRAVAIAHRGSVPKTTSGKVRRSACREAYIAGALPLLAVSEETSSRPAVMPVLAEIAPSAWRGSLTMAICGAVADTVGLPHDSVLPSDPLAGTGLDSVSATSIQHRLQRAYGVRLAPLTLLGDGTAEQAAQFVVDALERPSSLGPWRPGASAPEPAQERARARITELIPDRPAIIELAACAVAIGPISPLQRSLWFEHHLAAGTPAYTLVRAVRLGPETPSAEALSEAVRQVVHRHPALRTRLLGIDGDPIAVVTDGSDIELHHEDLCDRPAADLAARLERETLDGCDLDGGRLTRFTLLDAGPSQRVLLLTAHHAIADQWSLHVVLRDLMAMATPSGEALLPVLISALDQAHGSQAGASRDSRQYWRERLAGVPAHIELPLDHPRPAVRGFRGRSVPFAVGADLVDRLHALSRAHRTTLFGVLHTAMAVMLGQRSDQRDLILGTVAGGRDDADLADVVGCFVNPVAIRVTTSPDDSFALLLERQRQHLTADLAHADHPFEQVVADLAISRSPATTPLIQVMLVHQGRLAALPVGLDPVPLHQPWSHSDLVLDVGESENGLTGTWIYDPDLFEAASVQSLSDSLVRFLHRCAEEPDRRLDLLPMMSANETMEEIRRATGPLRPPDFLGLAHCAERTARQFPDATAIVAIDEGDERVQISYRHLDRASRQVATLLADRGAGSECRVGVLMSRSQWLPIAMHGVLQRGAVIVPLDPADPPQRLAWLIADAGIDVVLTAGVPRIPLPAGVHVIDVTVATSTEPLVNGPIAVHPDAAAALLYTSGSTGTPKGVLLTHAGLANRLNWMQDEFGLEPGERVLHKTPITFDVALWELLWPLRIGACLVIAPPGAHRDPDRLARIIDDEQISVTHFVPTMLDAFLQDPAAGAASLAALRLLVVSGEVLTSRLRDAAHQRLTAELVNLYGPTEASIDVSCWHCSPSDAGAPPIGRPIANVSAHVLGPGQGPVPPGTRGQLWIGGAAPARGYVGRPGETAAAFQPDPTAGPGRRRYATGDLATQDADGVLSFRGRRDDQVKISGHRIEPAEIEAVLTGLPDVAAAAVGVHHDGTGARLFAQVVMADQSGLRSAGDLRELVLEKLPAALVPAAITIVSTLPRTASGKLDRSSLPAPQFRTAARAAPATPMEQSVAKVWSAVLETGPPDTDTDFFVAGGDSIRAVRLASALRAAGVIVDVAELIAAGTVRRIAAVATGRSADGDQPGEDGADIGPEPAAFALCPPHARTRLPADVVDAYPMSMAQRAILYQQTTNPGHEVYVTSVRVGGSLNRDALAAAVRAACERHPYLRSSFDLTSAAQPLQLIHRSGTEQLEVIDLRDHSTGDAESALTGWLRSERRRRIDVQAGSLARFTVHQCSDSEFVLSISSFALDGWCTATLLTELLTEHTARAAGASPGLTAPACGYPSFVAAEQRAQDDAVHRRFWAAQVDSAPDCRVGTGTGDGNDSLTERVVRVVPPDVAASLRAVAVALGVSLKSVLLAAHLQAVRTLTGQADVLTGFEVNGRPARPGGDRAIGVFNNIVPLRVRLSGTWADLVTAAARAEADLLPHRRYPFARLQRDHDVLGKLDTLFVFTDFHVYRSLDDIGVTLLAMQAPDRTYVPLTVHVNADSGTGALRLLVDFEPGSVCLGRAQNLADVYLRALNGIARHTYRSASNDSLLEPAQVADLLSIASSASAGVRDGTVDALILDQARRTPDAIAVTCGNQAVTYAGLEARSRLLAHALQDAGAGPDHVIAVPGTRGVDLVVALLGVMRAGCAYLPLDPAHPAVLRDRILAQAGVHLIAGPAPGEFVPPAGCRVVETGAAGTAVAPLRRPAPPRHPAGLAYVLSTSGSTGVPKLIAVPHSAVVNYLHWCAKAYLPTPGSRTPVHSPPGFDLTVTSLLVPLVTGGTVDLLPDASGPEALGAAATAGADGILKITPRHLAALGEQIHIAGAHPSFSAIVVGGEQLYCEQLRRWRGFRVINEYGPTEATVGCCTSVVTHEQRSGPLPIGEPIDGAGAHLLDDGHPVPSGVVAELSITGAGLARGYLGDGAATAAAFGPFRYGSGERAYRTGDLGLRDEGGQLHLMGRTDRQIKIRGHRIEPGQVEQELLAHPAVRDVAVTAAPDRSGLVAYWVPAAPHGSDPGFAAWLRARLPAAMVPQSFVDLPALPLTARGKIDEAALPDPAADRREALLALAERLPSDQVTALLDSRNAGSQS